MYRLTKFHHQHRSTTIRSEVFRWIHHEDNEEEEEEEEERFVRLERRLVLNVEFDDALQVLEFYSDNY
jgi:hypothetical protein